MIEYRFTSIRRIDGQTRKVIVDIYGDIINRNPKKEELKGLRLELTKKELYSNEELFLELLRYFYKKEGKVPEERDFNNCHKYPSYITYIRHFGSWTNAIKKAGLWKKRYNHTHTCDRCGISFDKIGFPLRELDEIGHWTGRWDCYNCHEKYVLQVVLTQENQ